MARSKDGSVTTNVPSAEIREILRFCALHEAEPAAAAALVKSTSDTLKQARDACDVIQGMVCTADGVLRDGKGDHDAAFDDLVYFRKFADSAEHILESLDGKEEQSISSLYNLKNTMGSSARAMDLFDKVVEAARLGDDVAIVDLLGPEARGAHGAVLADASGLVGASVNSTAAGMTPLHLAALLGRAECADSLIAAGADVRALTTVRPCSAAMLACFSMQEGATSVLCALILAGCDLEERNAEGVTLVSAACTTANLSKVQVLLEAGAPVVSIVIDGDRVIRTSGVRIENYTIVINATSVRGNESHDYTVATWRDRSGAVRSLRSETKHEFTCSLM